MSLDNIHPQMSPRTIKPEHQQGGQSEDGGQIEGYEG